MLRQCNSVSGNHSLVTAHLLIAMTDVLLSASDFYSFDGCKNAQVVVTCHWGHMLS